MLVYITGLSFAVTFLYVAFEFIQNAWRGKALTNSQRGREFFTGVAFALLAFIIANLASVIQLPGTL